MGEGAVCNGCGGPLTMVLGQSMVVSGTIETEDDDGRISGTITGGWCGRCLAEWDARMELKEN